MQSAARKSRESQAIYPSSHGELLLRIRGKRSEVTKHTGSRAILRISVTTLIGMRHSRLACVFNGQ